MQSIAPAKVRLLRSGSREPISGPKRGFFILLDWFLHLYFRIFHGFETKGEDGVPMDGPLIVVSNHPSYYDPFLIGAASPRLFRYMAYEGLWSVGWLGRLIEKMGAFMVDQNSPLSGFKAANALLENGEAIVLFPEGGRSPDGSLQELKSGAARLALRTGATILPVTVTGAYWAYPIRNLIPRPGRIRVEFHKPIKIRESDRQADDQKAVIEDLNEKIATTMEEVIEPARRATRRKKALYDRPTPPRIFEVLPLVTAGVAISEHLLPHWMMWPSIGYVLYLLFDWLAIPPGRLTIRFRTAAAIGFLALITGVGLFPFHGALLSAAGCLLLLWSLVDIAFWSSWTRFLPVMTSLTAVTCGALLLHAVSGTANVPAPTRQTLAIILAGGGLFGTLLGRNLRGPLGSVWRPLFAILVLVGLFLGL